ncbi:NADH dehydrogenase [ubiquinone] 1 beta subcomplex subunit 7, partial [Cucurbita argyrosperma subsp. sororia]
MEVQGSSKKMIATQAEMVEARVPIPYRDQCAHLLIPLNKCRQSEFYLPWKCENERHSYEKCEYELVMERMLQMQKIHCQCMTSFLNQETVNCCDVSVSLFSDARY